LFGIIGRIFICLVVGVDLIEEELLSFWDGGCGLTLTLFS
jgi:hypothetical protein